MFTNEMPNIEDALTFAIDAIERGEMKQGTAALEWILQREPGNPYAWLWMACIVPDEQAKRDCYLRAGP